MFVIFVLFCSTGFVNRNKANQYPTMTETNFIKCVNKKCSVQRKKTSTVKSKSVTKKHETSKARKNWNKGSLWKVHNKDGMWFLIFLQPFIALEPISSVSLLKQFLFHIRLNVMSEVVLIFPFVSS